MEPLVYIILVNYRNSNDTIECIKSLREIDYLNYKVLIVDNASQDDSVEKLKKEILDEELIVSDENLGFAGGNNLGIDKAIASGAKYVLLLNNDTVVKKDFLSKLVDTFKVDNNIGIVGCKINYYSDRDIVNYAGGEIDWSKFTTRFYGLNTKDNNDTKIRYISFVSGCAMMIKREVIEKIGLLDDTYFMYYEDTDYCARAIESSFKLAYQPKSVIYHKVSASSGGELSPFVLYWSTKNREKFKRKFSNKISKKKLIYFNIFNFFSRIARVFLYYFKGEFLKGNSIIKGYIDGIRGR
ncbi:glycosyltransferase family 2 protein [Clostridium perfringens]|uniref:glycosyltransferase family 2 protein n=1 Tax=Clostridium perfringens TaxID=1502 RepID=UPI0039E8681B